MRVHRSRIPDHPHDELSYLHGLPGGSGYLLILRLLVPPDAEPHNGLTVFSGWTGRYPVPSTVIFD